MTKKGQNWSKLIRTDQKWAKNHFLLWSQLNHVHLLDFSSKSGAQTRKSELGHFLKKRVFFDRRPHTLSHAKFRGFCKSHFFDSWSESDSAKRKPWNSRGKVGHPKITKIASAQNFQKNGVRDHFLTSKNVTFLTPFLDPRTGSGHVGSNVPV